MPGSQVNAKDCIEEALKVLLCVKMSSGNKMFMNEVERRSYCIVFKQGNHRSTRVIEYSNDHEKGMVR